mmetsp:Transcript_39739/g.81374  ORF Transcript_39739/g.81374 Transcript_39739/m.81374 type:complete len:1709 (+) Transcript_39739:173-5299(+)
MPGPHSEILDQDEPDSTSQRTAFNKEKGSHVNGHEMSKDKTNRSKNPSIRSRESESVELDANGVHSKKSFQNGYLPQAHDPHRTSDDDHGSGTREELYSVSQEKVNRDVDGSFQVTGNGSSSIHRMNGNGESGLHMNGSSDFDVPTAHGANGVSSDEKRNRRDSACESLAEGSGRSIFCKGGSAKKDVSFHHSSSSNIRRDDSALSGDAGTEGDAQSKDPPVETACDHKDKENAARQECTRKVGDEILPDRKDVDGRCGKESKEIVLASGKTGSSECDNRSESGESMSSSKHTMKLPQNIMESEEQSTNGLTQETARKPECGDEDLRKDPSLLSPDMQLIESLAAAAILPQQPVGAMESLQVGGMQVIPQDLAKHVEEHGGVAAVEKGNLWDSVARGMGIDAKDYERDCADVASCIKKIFYQEVLQQPLPSSHPSCRSNPERSETESAAASSKRDEGNSTQSKSEQKPSSNKQEGSDVKERNEKHSLKKCAQGERKLDEAKQLDGKKRVEGAKQGKDKSGAHDPKKQQDKKENKSTAHDQKKPSEAKPKQSDQKPCEKQIQKERPKGHSGDGKKGKGTASDSGKNLEPAGRVDSSAKKSDKLDQTPGSSKRSEKGDKVEGGSAKKVERGENGKKTEKSEKSENGHGAKKVEKAETSHGAKKTEKSEKGEQGQSAKKAEKTEKPESVQLKKPERSERPDVPASAKKAEKAEKEVKVSDGDKAVDTSSRTKRETRERDDSDDESQEIRRSKKQVLEQMSSEQGKSREERKLQAIMRQFELLEKKEKGTGECSEADGMQRKRKDPSDDQGSEGDPRERKRSRGADDDDVPGEQDISSAPAAPAAVEAPFNADSRFPKNKGPRPPPKTIKERVEREQQAGGGLCALRYFKLAQTGQRRRPCLPCVSSEISPSASLPGTPRSSSEVNMPPRNCLPDDSAAKMARLAGGKKSYILASICENSQVVPEVLEVEPPAVYQIGRLNPHRRVEDTGRVPLKKKLICRWKLDESFEEPDEHPANVHVDPVCKVECSEEPKDERKEAPEDLGERSTVEEVPSITMEEEEVEVKMELDEEASPYDPEKCGAFDAPCIEQPAESDAEQGFESKEIEVVPKSEPAVEDVRCPLPPVAPSRFQPLPDVAEASLLEVKEEEQVVTTDAPSPGLEGTERHGAAGAPAAALFEESTTLQTHERGCEDMSDSPTAINAPTGVSAPIKWGLTPLTPETKLGVAPLTPDALTPEAKLGLAPLTPEAKSLTPDVKLGLTPLTPEAKFGVAPLTPDAKLGLTPLTPEPQAPVVESVPLTSDAPNFPGIPSHAVESSNEGFFEAQSRSQNGPQDAKDTAHGEPYDPFAAFSSGPLSERPHDEASADAAGGAPPAMAMGEGRAGSPALSTSSKDAYGSREAGQGTPLQSSAVSVSPARSGNWSGGEGARGEENGIRRSAGGTPGSATKRASAWDQPPPQMQNAPLGGSLKAKSISPAVDREVERSNAIRNLPDMRDIRRIEPSPPPLMTRRRMPSPPPRPLYTGEMRERGMNVAEGGLSRESLRREREDALLRERDRFGPSPAGSGVDSPRSRAMLDRPLPVSQWDVAPRSRSPRTMDRSWERMPGGGGGSLGRDRSLSPRSKEVQREIQAARERRASNKDCPDVPEPMDMDGPMPMPMRGWQGGAGRGGWWVSGAGRGGSPGPAGVPGPMRRDRMLFDQRRRAAPYNSPPRNR